MKKVIVLLFLISGTLGFSQNLELQALVNQNTVEVGGNFTITFRFNASGDDFSAPNNFTKDFRILSGPNKSSSMSFVNGQMSSSVSYSYILSPINAGTFTIGSASIEEDDKVYSSKPVKIKVVKGNRSAQKQQPSQSDINAKEKDLRDVKKNLFLKLELSKRTAYVGEQIIATYKLYNRTRLNGIEGQRMPEFDGFYTSDFEITNANNHSREIINGITYDIYTLKKTILIPQKSGELKLIPLEIDANIQVQDSKPINTWFGPKYQYHNTTVSIKTAPATITVKPLPSGAPKSFTGAVGTFKLMSSIIPFNLATNDPINYTIKISGTGNLPLIDHPTPAWPQEFEVYDPKLKSNIKKTSGKLSGSKTWEYLAIPRNKGEYHFEPLKFTFFNLSTKKYQTITSDSTIITVTGDGNSAQGSNMGSAVNKQDVSRIGTDIRYIHTQKTEFQQIGNVFFGTVWFYLWVLSPIFIGALAFVVIQQQNKLQQDTVGLKKRRATKFAQIQLKQAEETLKSNNQNEFHEAVFKALTGYIGNKLTITNANLNKNYIKTQLLDSGVSKQTVQTLIETLDHCEMARFAPTSSISSQDLLAKAKEIIVQLEDEIK